MPPSPKRQRKHNFPFRNEATLPDWWLELTPHHTLNLEDEQARRDAEDRMALHYAELAVSDAENGKMCDVDGHPLVGEFSNNSSSSVGHGIASRWTGRSDPNNNISSNSNNGSASKMFGGRNFQPGSPGWDTHQWGIDDQDPDFDAYQSGDKLPPQFVTAMNNYAKATGHYRDVNDDASHVRLRSSNSTQYGRVAEKPAFEPEFMKVKLRSRKNWRTAGAAVMATKGTSTAEKEEKAEKANSEDTVEKEATPIVREKEPDHKVAPTQTTGLFSNTEATEVQENDSPEILHQQEEEKTSGIEEEYEEEIIEEQEAEQGDYYEEEVIEDEEIIEEEVLDDEDLAKEIAHMVEQEEDIPALKFADPSPEKQAIFRQMRRGSAVATPPSNPSNTQARDVPRTISNDFQEGGEVVEYTPEEQRTNGPAQQMRRGSAVATLPPNWKPRAEILDRRDGMTRAISQDFVEGGEVVEARYHTTRIEEEQEDSNNPEVAQATRDAQPFEREAVITTPTKSNQRNNQQSIGGTGDYPSFLENTTEQTVRSKDSPEGWDGWRSMTTEEKRSRARLLAMYYAELASHDEEEGKACDVSGIPIQSKKRRQRWTSPSHRRSRSRAPDTPRRSWRAFSADKQREQTPDRRVTSSRARDSRGRSRSPRRQRAQTTGRRRNATPTRSRRFWFFGKKRSKMFGGLEYKSESKDWDPSDWGIDWTHHEYDYHLTTELLPPNYVSAMFNYAKLTGKTLPFHDDLLDIYLNKSAATSKQQVQPRGVSIVVNQRSTPVSQHHQLEASTNNEAEEMETIRKALPDEMAAPVHIHDPTPNFDKEEVENDRSISEKGAEDDLVLSEKILNTEPASGIVQEEEISMEPANGSSETQNVMHSQKESRDHIQVKEEPKNEVSRVNNTPILSKRDTQQTESNTRASSSPEKWQTPNKAVPGEKNDTKSAPWRKKVRAAHQPTENKTRESMTSETTQSEPSITQKATQPNDALVVIPPKKNKISGAMSESPALERPAWQIKAAAAAKSSRNNNSQKASPLRKRAPWEKPLDANPHLEGKAEVSELAEEATTDGSDLNSELSTGESEVKMHPSAPEKKTWKRPSPVVVSGERNPPWVKKSNASNSQSTTVPGRAPRQKTVPSTARPTGDQVDGRPANSPSVKKQWQRSSNEPTIAEAPQRKVAPWQKPKSDVLGTAQSDNDKHSTIAEGTSAESKQRWQRPPSATNTNNKKTPWAKKNDSSAVAYTPVNKPSWQKPKQLASPDTASPVESTARNGEPVSSTTIASSSKASWVKDQNGPPVSNRAPWQKSAASTSGTQPDQKGSKKAAYFSKFTSNDNAGTDTDDDEIIEEIIESEDDESYVEVEVSDSEAIEEVSATEYEEEIIEEVSVESPPSSPKSRWGHGVGVSRETLEV